MTAWKAIPEDGRLPEEAMRIGSVLVRRPNGHDGWHVALAFYTEPKSWEIDARVGAIMSHDEYCLIPE